MTQVSVITAKSVGGTFIDWSIHFLAGKSQYYNTKLGLVPLTQDPLTNKNAHNHLKNHPNGLEDFEECLNRFSRLTKDGIYSTYPAPMRTHVAAKMLNIEHDQIAANFEKISQYISEDFNRLLETCYNQKIKLVVIDTDPSMSLYFLQRRSLHWVAKLGHPESLAEAKEEFQNMFFKKSIETWEQLNLNNIWDQREREALDTKLITNNEVKIRNLTGPHYWIHCQDLWGRGHSAIKQIMRYLELDIVPDRYDSWLPIYQKWQKIQFEAMEFVYNCQHIVNSIINNWYYEINLTFEQEVIIQHLLIHQHNLNIKTWGLVKFPNNTKELHRLLEPNIHPIQS